MQKELAKACPEALEVYYHLRREFGFKEEKDLDFWSANAQQDDDRIRVEKQNGGWRWCRVESPVIVSRVKFLTEVGARKWGMRFEDGFQHVLRRGDYHKRVQEFVDLTYIRTNA